VETHKATNKQMQKM